MLLVVDEDRCLLTKLRKGLLKNIDLDFQGADLRRQMVVVVA